MGPAAPGIAPTSRIRGDTIARIAPSIAGPRTRVDRRCRPDRLSRLHRYSQPRAREHLRAADGGQLHPAGRHDDHRRSGWRVAGSARPVPRQAGRAAEIDQHRHLHRPGIGARSGPRPREQPADAGRARQDARARRRRYEGRRLRHEHGPVLCAGRVYADRRSHRARAGRGASTAASTSRTCATKRSACVDSVQETIRIGEEGGLPTQVTHHKIVGTAKLRQERRDAEAARRRARARRRCDERSVSVHRVEQRVRRRR